MIRKNNAALLNQVGIKVNHSIIILNYWNKGSSLT